MGDHDAPGLHASDVILVSRPRAEPRKDGEHVGYALLVGVLLASIIGVLERNVGLLGLGRTLAHQGEVMRRRLGAARKRCPEQAGGKSSAFDPRHVKSRDPGCGQYAIWGPKTRRGQRTGPAISRKS